MRKRLLSTLGACVAVLLMAAAACFAQATVSSTATTSGIPRIGINLNQASFYGADQFLQNVLMNPGFEATVDSRIIYVANPTWHSFQDNMNWLDDPIGFYNGAAFSVRSGASAGQTGTISGYNPNNGGNPTFTCQKQCPPLASGDIVAVTKIDPPSELDGWWYNDPDINRAPYMWEPNSHGTSSLKVLLNGSSHRIDSYLDTMQPPQKTINFLPVTGQWTVSFWARTTGKTSGASIVASFMRDGDGTNGNNQFISQTVTPGGRWQQYTFTFTGTENGSLGPLDFNFVMSGKGGCIYIDDVFLGPAVSAGSFREEVASTLGRLNPGVIRDWQGQNGDTYLYRTGDYTARGPVRTNNGTGVGSYVWSYSLTDFFPLVSSLNASPWIILPVTATDSDLHAYGQFLCAQESIYSFPQILIELGDENWNGAFRGAGIIDVTHYGEVAQRDFGLIAASCGSPALKFVGAGQYANPDQVRQVAAAIPGAAYVAAAPYFFACMDTGQSQATYLDEMLNDFWSVPSNNMIPIVQNLQPGQTAVAYEENLTTLGGSALTSERYPIVGGYASGTALLQQIIHTMDSGFAIQNGWSLTGLYQLSANNYWGPSGQCNSPSSNQNVPLFGVVHDLNAAYNFIRPTGLAIELANQVVQGDFYRMDTTAYPGVSGAAFLGTSGWTAMMTNSSATAIPIVLNFPAGAGVPSVMQQLNYTTSVTDENETSPLVSIAPGGPITSLGAGAISFTIPAYGAIALEQ